MIAVMPIFCWLPVIGGVSKFPLNLCAPDSFKLDVLSLARSSLYIFLVGPQTLQIARKWLILSLTQLRSFLESGSSHRATIERWH